MKPARFTLSFAFCKPFRQAQATQQRKNGAQPALHCSNDSDKEGRYPGKNDQKKRGPDPAIIRTNYLRKSTKNRSKIREKPSQIDEKSLLDGFGRQKPFRGPVGTRSGRDRDAPKPAQGRSWDGPGAPRGTGRRPRATPGRFQDAPERVRSDVEARAARQAPSDSSSQRFFVVFVLSRKSSDVLFAWVFTAFCWLRAK